MRTSVLRVRGLKKVIWFSGKNEFHHPIVKVGYYCPEFGNSVDCKIKRDLFFLPFSSPISLCHNHGDVAVCST
jgi:hypothetical protein